MPGRRASYRTCPPPVLKKALRQHLQQTCQEQDLRQWYDPLAITLSKDDKRLDVQFPHPFFAQWFSATAQVTFESRLREFLGDGYALRYTSGNGGSPQAAPARAAAARQLDYPFGPRFTFDTFLHNRKNQFPVASAKEVARDGRDPHDRVYNPFVVCGGSGNGKTHLLRAIANELSRSRDDNAIFCGAVDELGTRFSGLSASGPGAAQERQQARSRLCAQEVLVVDDLQRLRDLPFLQDELTFAFDHFHDNGKQMVFACSGKLADLDFLSPKLRSRLEWGLIVELREPDLDVRVKFIQQQSRSRNIQLSKEHVLTLAQRFREFRHLQGILVKVGAYRQLVNRDIQDRELEQILRHTDSGKTTSLTPETVIAATAEQFGIPARDIVGDKRQQSIVQARQVAMFLCRELLGSSFPALGRVFGGKDHSTAMYAVRKIKQLQQSDKDMQLLVTDLKRKCLTRAE